MKRSELLKEIFKTFHTCRHNMGYGDEKALDRALERAEELGMLPPTRYLDINQWAGLSGNDPIVDLELAKTNSWEPEDDICGAV